MIMRGNLANEFAGTLKTKNVEVPAPWTLLGPLAFAVIHVMSGCGKRLFSELFFLVEDVLKVFLKPAVRDFNSIRAWAFYGKITGILNQHL